MKVRNVIPTDIPQLIEMYRNIFKVEMTIDIYNYLYFDIENQLYFSVVTENNGIISGHNAIIPREYLINNEIVKVGLSSGGMVYPEFSGSFYIIMKKNISDFIGDIIIAFPNKNSEKFFTRIFKFKDLGENYFSVTPESFTNNSNCISDSHFHRSLSFIKTRIYQHPYHKYHKIEIEDTIVYFKNYNETEIDIIYATKFGDNFIKIIEKLLKGINKINIIHWNSYYMQSLGFIPETNNTFVYKFLTNNFVNFECQMIDSDIF